MNQEVSIMKKQFIGILATILILATLLSGCGSAEPASSSPSLTETAAGSENIGRPTETETGNENAGQPTETEIGSENVGQPVETEESTEAPPVCTPASFSAFGQLAP